MVAPKSVVKQITVSMLTCTIRTPGKKFGQYFYPVFLKSICGKAWHCFQLKRFFFYVACVFAYSIILLFYFTLSFFFFSLIISSLSR